MKNRAGFTLIELMVVVGLMILVTAITISGSFGMTRSSGFRGAEDLVFNTLQFARQKACVEGKETLVIFYDDKEENKYGADSFIVVQAAGVITGGLRDGNYFEDRSSTINDGTLTNTVWSLKNGRKAYIRNVGSSVGSEFVPGDERKYKYATKRIYLKPESGETLKKTDWEKGDIYGFNISSVQILPKGFKIGWNSSLGSVKKKCIVFKPDGTSQVLDNGNVSGDTVDLYIYEKIQPDAKKAIKIMVKDGVEIDG